MNQPSTPSVLFVCGRNSGKSQMAAGLIVPTSSLRLVDKVTAPSLSALIHEPSGSGELELAHAKPGEMLSRTQILVWAASASMRLS